MSDEEFATTLFQTLALRDLVLVTDLSRFVSRSGAIHAIGPVLDPTTYREKAKNSGSASPLPGSC